MKSTCFTTALTSTVLALGLMGASPASWAVETFTATTGADKPAKARKAKAGKAPKLPGDKGSGENKAERDKRLLRECRGKPNAGACEGYAH
ncbi:hypothetical protein B9Z47_17495 [Limnohabitans sp. 2KL-1]|jgi:hypothetical protein|uniref:hypothetical protein n=1 Tax=Limnohabitans sp. 2KL-1 TaxID=1100699 RepID=UPI000D3629FB|nr:hypothetical protein [Limnohabitans sp. 2KL-1]PUE44806.1 hypothetical protein B9Z47_17495 [Limnohabitans sp. 2KL-1]